MNKAEILAMEAGAELDALVLREIFGCNVEIRAMGWNEDGGPKYCYCLCEGTDKQYEHRDWEHHYGAAISPSEDISAAWQVWETMRAGDYDCYITHCKLGYEASFIKEKDFIAQAKAAPEAICKAALLTRLEGGT